MAINGIKARIGSPPRIRAGISDTAVLLERDYDRLYHKPQINGVELSGNKTSEDIKEFYVHKQMTAERVWTIVHNMGKFPSVTVVDSGGNVVVGNVYYIDENSLAVSYAGEFSGKAYLN